MDGELQYYALMYGQAAAEHNEPAVKAQGDAWGA